MSSAIADRVFAAILFLLGIYVTVSAVGLGLWVRGVPGPGFFPVMSGVMMTLLAGSLLLRQFRAGPTIREFIPIQVAFNTIGMILSLCLFVALTPVLGIFLGAVLMMLAVGVLASDKPRLTRGYLLRLAAVAIGTAMVCGLLFGRVLGVPLPTGAFGI